MSAYMFRPTTSVNYQDMSLGWQDCTLSSSARVVGHKDEFAIGRCRGRLAGSFAGRKAAANKGNGGHNFC